MFFMREKWGWNWETMVGYGGSADNLRALVGGEIDISLTTLGAARPLLEDDRIETVLIVHSEGSSINPEAPAPASRDEYESFDFVAGGIRGYWAPPETPDERIQVLTEAVEQGLESEEVQSWAEETGTQIKYRTPEEMDEVLENVIEEVPENVDLDELREE
jgi:tripartite-type tricarboxylate transporter receptor subunit TctC